MVAIVEAHFEKLVLHVFAVCRALGRQRLHDLGLGMRLPTYAFPDEALAAAVLRLAADRPLRTRLSAIASRLQAAPGTVRAADLIERLALEQRPVLRAA